MAMSVQQGDLPQKENTMKRLFAGTLALVMTCGLLFSGCGKQMTPEEEAASQEAAISQQLQDEENKTGLKRLISNNLTEYEQPVHDFIEGLQDGHSAFQTPSEKSFRIGSLSMTSRRSRKRI